MNNANLKIYLISLITCFILISCESDKDNDSGFSIKFSDGTIIHEKDIIFYDSSTCILFINKELNLNIGTEEPPINCTEFSVFVNKDIIYQGVIYPDYLFNFVPPTAIYISSKTYPTFKSNIIPIKGLKNTVNNTRIIIALESSNLLHHGISCIIDRINIASYNDSSAIFTITIKNYDHVNYYIPDPKKMGALLFNYLSRIHLINKETNEGIYPKTFYVPSDWNLTVNDLSILKSESKVTYTFTSLYSSKIKKGLYDCYLTFSNIKHCKPITITLDQENGRVWVGENYSSIKNIMIE